MEKSSFKPWENLDNRRKNIGYIEQIKTGVEQKAQLILVLLDIKPAAELTLYKWNSSPEEAEVQLAQAGLEFQKKEGESNDKITAIYAVSKDKDLLNKLIHCNSDREYGELMGYPKTAIDAFEKNDVYDGPLPEDIENSIFKLRFSKANHDEEFEVVRKWNRALTQYAPNLK